VLTAITIYKSTSLFFDIQTHLIFTSPDNLQENSNYKITSVKRSPKQLDRHIERSRLN